MVIYDWERKFNNEKETRVNLYLYKETSRGYYVKKYDLSKEKLTYLSKKEAFKEYYASYNRRDGNCHEFWILRTVNEAKIDIINHPDYGGKKTLTGLFKTLRSKTRCKRNDCKWINYGYESYSNFGEESRWDCLTCKKEFIVNMNKNSPVYDNAGKVVDGIDYGKVVARKTYLNKQRQYRTGVGGCTTAHQPELRPVN